MLLLPRIQLCDRSSSWGPCSITNRWYRTLPDFLSPSIIPSSKKQPSIEHRAWWWIIFLLFSAKFCKTLTTILLGPTTSTLFFPLHPHQNRIDHFLLAIIYNNIQHHLINNQNDRPKKSPSHHIASIGCHA